MLKIDEIGFLGYSYKLAGARGEEMINTDFSINFNSDGVFQSVNYNGEQYSIKDYNKLFETQNPNGNN